MSRNPHKNKLKTAVAVTLAAVFAVSGAIIAIATVQKDETPTNGSQTSSSQQVESSNGSLLCGQKGGACSKAEIATRNTKSNCWVIYKSHYYDVSTYASKHPGGSTVFNDETCGKDIEDFLNGNAATRGQSNAHGSSAFKELETYKVGPVEP